MKLKVYDTSAKETGEIELPVQFNDTVRTDIIKRAVIAQQNKLRVPYGAHPLAGKKYSAYVSKRRRDYKGTYGKGISRTPRKILTRRGVQFYWVGAFAPQTVGGRRAHPPKSSRNWVQKMNRKERRVATRSAISATVHKDLVQKNGYKIPTTYPFVLDGSFESIAKTKDAMVALQAIGLQDDFARAKEKKVRAGKGKSRGRKYRKKVGPLLVVSQQCALEKGARNIPGVEVIEVKQLHPLALAPGNRPGRATYFTKGAIEELTNKKLFC